MTQSSTYDQAAPKTQEIHYLRRSNAEMLAALHTLRKLYGAIADDLTMDPRFPWESAPEAYKAAWRNVRDLLAKSRLSSATPA